jgi:integrase
MAKRKQKEPKISISEKGKYVLRLRFTYHSEPFELTVPGQNIDSWNRANEIRSKIISDVRHSVFDISLNRYRQLSGTTVSNPLLKESSIRNISYLNLFKLYLEEKGYLQPNLAADSEFSTYRMASRWPIHCYTDIRSNFLKMNYANSTFTDRLIVLKKWCAWMANKSYIQENPLINVKYKKRYPKKNPLREPLPDAALLETVNAIKEDKFKSPLTYYKDSVYYAPINFILYTGCRPQEAVGVRCRYIDFVNREVKIMEVLARKRNLTSHKNLIRKEPKTDAGKRIIPLVEELVEMVKEHCSNKSPDDLVFLSQKGLAIDSRRMCKVWKKYLKNLGYPEMDVYGLRHAFGTRRNEQGFNPVDGAEKMGHADVAVFLNTYSHRTRNRQALLPVIGKG